MYLFGNEISTPVQDAARSAYPLILTGHADLAFRDNDADLSGTGGPARIAKCPRCSPDVELSQRLLRNV